MSWPNATAEVVQEMLLAMREKCGRCGETRYAHHDHQHVANCPFGDCGNFERVMGAD